MNVLFVFLTFPTNGKLILDLSVTLLHLFYTVSNNIIFQKLYSEFEMHGMEPDKLNSQHWQLVEQRMQTEEASCALCQGEQGGNENG